MPYIGKQPSKVPLTSADIVDGTISNDDLAGSINQSKLAGSIALSKLATTGTGSSSNFLRGDGAYAEAGGGAWELISTVNVTAVTDINITSGFSASYSNYRLIFSKIRPTSTENKLVLRTSSDGGSSWALGSTYKYVSASMTNNTTTHQATGNNGTHEMPVSNLMAYNSWDSYWDIYIQGMGETAYTYFIFNNVFMESSNSYVTCDWGTGVSQLSTVTNALNVRWYNGNTFQAQGKYYLLGQKV